MLLNRYSVEIIISGIDSKKDPFAKKEIENEIRMRSHIILKLIKENKKQLYVVFEIDSIDEKTALAQAFEEVFEILNAVLNSIEGVDIHKGNAKLVQK